MTSVNNNMSIGQAMALISKAASDARKGDLASAQGALGDVNQTKADLREQLSALRDKAEGYRDADPDWWKTLWGAEERNLRRLAYTSNRITTAQSEMAAQDEALEAARADAQDTQEVFGDSMKVVEDLRGYIKDVGRAVDDGVLV